MADEATLVLRAEALVAAATLLRDHPSARFRLLSDLTAAHWPGEERPFHVVYHLYSFDHNRRLRLKVKLRDGEEAPSVTGVWSGANWMEREAYDLFGVRFKGHPDLRRILLPEDWGSHPLRKDYPLEGRGERVYTKPKRKEFGE
ncbi:MAG: NADH-quinone oxidoreductase subunit C [Candidatus Tectomicrobia bacterium]|uniref:NADH-quinone oxidoreductase subunit C n=1 Tax=Tectimicrobiota bacterium TaxID=2528274 RepID=A0A932I3V9_UNCTE|nr:NADH-quinone oxidoreductase subunit C [Candidatus Tectomicrobia bacterium]